MPNRLAQETSPYLLQHKDNPVDWHPWGEEAIAKAKQEDKPIFLSIGYSACHWCHVMEHESFEDDAIAQMLNEGFIPVKVDREERPDLDQIYMNAVQMLTGHGGWPMSVFLTPDLKPFYGGTYWPPRSGRGMPGFNEILEAVSEAWRHRRQQALEGAEQLTAELRKFSLTDGTTNPEAKLSIDLLDSAVRQFGRAFDHSHGGFGGAPKFPHPMSLQVLLRHWHRSAEDMSLVMARHTLDQMAAGGIYDHLGGGFARYSVDARWLVPHFEKMLYDNALLAQVCVDAHLATSEPSYARIAKETLDYVLRDMTGVEGGFYSTEDADSEGEEGKFYTWTPDEIEAALGSDRAHLFCRVYGVTEEGNFEGRNILHLVKTHQQYAALLECDEQQLADQLAECRAILLATRESRVRPGRDDKIIVAWNGLMIDALARAGAALDDSRYLTAAARAADFLVENLRRDDGKLLHTWRGGSAKLNAYLDDYTCFANSLVSLYEASFEERWLDTAVELLDIVLHEFKDHQQGGFYYTANDHEPLIARTKELTDASTPSGSAMGAWLLLRLGKLLGRNDYIDAAIGTLGSAVDIMGRAPLATGQMLLALDLHVGPTYELLLVTDEDEESAQRAIRILHRHYLPNCLIAARSDSVNESNKQSSPHLDLAFRGKVSVDRQPTLYICQNFTCQEPTVGLDSIAKRITQLAQT